MDSYTHHEFLQAKADGKVKLVVNTGIYRKEVESKLPKEYHTAVITSTGLAIMIMILALLIYQISNWLFALLVIIGAVVFYVYTRKLNYRVYIKSQVKNNKKFFNYCHDHSVIRIVEI